MTDAWTVGHVTVDDVVFHDGRTAMHSIGGATVYAAVGAAVTGRRLGVVTRIGSDFPASALDPLRDSDIEVMETSIPHRCLWQWALYEEDGSRTFLPHPSTGTYAENSPRVGEGPPWDAVPALHVAPMPVRHQRPWVEAAHAAGVPVTMDPHHDSSRDDPDELWALIPGLRAFLPSMLEAERIHGPDPEAAAQAFVEAGAEVVAVKIGEDGSIVATREGTWHVPACSVELVDPTGAGDAYCGAFSAALAAGCDALQAARTGTVAASLTVERFGALAPLGAADAGEIARRLATVRPRPLRAVANR
ncbi:MAG: carbohydrate kinase family protein [Euzebyales bacterium]|nr:carbohydrate kinase family protein [Euzebyales bacterium]